VTAAKIEPTLSGEHTIRFGDGIEMDSEIHGQPSYRRQDSAWRKRTFYEQRPSGIDDLLVGRNL
jgi:hypothetical protein